MIFRFCVYPPEVLDSTNHVLLCVADHALQLVVSNGESVFADAVSVVSVVAKMRCGAAAACVILMTCVRPQEAVTVMVANRGKIVKLG